MKPNTITSLADLIDKLIAKHGSNEILIERLELIKDQVILSEIENQSLKNENASLIDRIKAYENARDGLTEEQRDILILLAGDPMNERDMIDALGRNAESIYFDLEALKASGLIKSKHMFAGLDVCSITPKGRSHLK
jgi:hypothetical protein